MKTITICIGLALWSLANFETFAEATNTQSSETTIETDHEQTTSDASGPKRKRNLRIERRVNGNVEVQEFNDGDVVGFKKPNVRRRIEVIEDDDSDGYGEGRVEVRPRIRVFPKEREVIIRGAPGKREMRVEFDSDAPALRRDILKGLPQDEPIESDEAASHVKEAIDHLKKAGMAGAAARLEAQLKMRSRRAETDANGTNQQLRSLQDERDTLRKEVRKLKRELQSLKKPDEPAKEKPEAEKKQ
jgi:hypothetical protein